MNVVTDAGLMQFAAGFLWAGAAICWAVVIFGARDAALQARWNAIAAFLAALASALMAASLIN